MPIKESLYRRRRQVTTTLKRINGDGAPKLHPILERQTIRTTGLEADGQCRRQLLVKTSPNRVFMETRRGRRLQRW